MVSAARTSNKCWMNMIMFKKIHLVKIKRCHWVIQLKDNVHYIQFQPCPWRWFHVKLSLCISTQSGLSYNVSDLTCHKLGLWWAYSWGYIWPICNTIWEHYKWNFPARFYQSALNPYWVIILMNKSGTNFMLNKPEDVSKNIHVTQIRNVICEYIILQQPCKGYGFVE